MLSLFESTGASKLGVATKVTVPPPSMAKSPLSVPVSVQVTPPSSSRAVCDATSIVSFSLYITAVAGVTVNSGLSLTSVRVTTSSQVPVFAVGLDVGATVTGEIETTRDRAGYGDGTGACTVR